MRRICAVLLLAVLGGFLGQVNSQDITTQPAPLVTQESDLLSTPNITAATEAPVLTPLPVTLAASDTPALPTTDVTPVMTLEPVVEATLESSAEPQSLPTLMSTQETALMPLPMPTTAEAVEWRLRVRELFETDPADPWRVPPVWRRDETQRLTSLALGKQDEQSRETRLPALRYETAWREVQTQAAFFLTETSRALLAVRVSDAGAYTAELDRTGLVRLRRGETLIAETLVTLVEQDPHTLTLSALGDTISVRVDDMAALTYVDAAPLPGGAVEISGAVSLNAVLALDDVFIWQHDTETDAVPTPTEVLPVPTLFATQTALPSLTPTEVAPLPTAEAAAPSDAEADTVSAQGHENQGTLALDTPQTRTLTWEWDRNLWPPDPAPQWGAIHTWTVNIPSAMDYVIEFESADPSLQPQFSHKEGTYTIYSFTSPSGHIITGFRANASTTALLTIYSGWQVSGDYTITVHTNQKPRVPYSAYQQTGYNSSSSYLYQPFWEFEVTTAGSYYLHYELVDYTPYPPLLIYDYAIRNRSTNSVITTGTTSSNSVDTLVYLANLTPGWYDVTLSKIAATSRGAYQVGLFPIPPAPVNFTVTEHLAYRLNFNWQADPTTLDANPQNDATKGYYILEENPGGGSSGIEDDWYFYDYIAVDGSQVYNYVIPDAFCGTRYAVLAYNDVTGYIRDAARFNAQLREISTQLCPPVNDSRNQAVYLAANTFPHNYTYSTATNNPISSAEDNDADPILSCASGGYAASVWYRYTPGNLSQMIEVNTFGSNYDTVIGVYQSVNNVLQEKACHDDYNGAGNDRTSQVVFTSEPNKIYYIMVAKWGIAYPELSAVAKVHINALKTPAAPVLSTPLNNGATNGPLTWNSVVNPNLSPAANIDTYHLQVATVSTFANRLIDLYLDGSQTAYNVVFDLADGKYYWRVRAVMPQGLTSAWSAPRLFVKDTVPPPAPVIAAPAANALVPTLRPTFTTSAMVGILQYQWQVAKTADFAPANVMPTVPSFTGTTALPITQALPQGQYYARARACDMAMNCGAYSPPRPFQIDLRQLPAANAPIIVTGPTSALTLRWGVPQGVTAFTVEIALDDTFNTVVQSKDFTITNPLYPPLTWTIPNIGSVLTHGAYYWRLVLTTPVLPTMALVPRRFIITPPVAAAPRLTAQPNAGILNTPTLTLNWQPVTYGYEVSYEVQVDNLSTFASPEYSLADIDAVTHTTTTLPDGVYYARVRAVNEFGGAGLWSTAIRVTLDTLSPPAPQITTPYAHVWTSSARQPTLWRPVTGATRYKIQYSRTNTFAPADVVIEAELAAAAAPLYTPGISLAQGSYYVRVAARDAALNWGDYSTHVPYTFVVNTSPVNNGNVLPVPVSASNGRPIFRWSPVAGATKYQVVVSTSETCTSDVLHISPELAPTVLAYTYPAPPAGTALGFGSYYWCVAVNRGAGTALNPLPNVLELPPAGFRVNISPTVPPTVTIGYPITTEPVATATVPLYWSEVFVGGQTLSYEVQIDDNPLFNTLDFSVTTALENGLYPETTALADGRYHLRVRAINNYGGVGAWSVVRVFTVDTQPPAVPVISTPAQQATVNTLLPTFSWGAVSGAVRYTVHLSHTSDFSAFYEWNVTTTTTLAPFALLHQMYYVRVQALDLAGNASEFSATRLFNVQWPATQAPIGTRYLMGTPTFTWEDVTWATRYEIQVSRNSTFTQTAVWTETNDTHFDMTQIGPLVDGIYFWRVRAGTPTQWFAWSDVITFAVDAP